MHARTFAVATLLSLAGATAFAQPTPEQPPQPTPEQPAPPPAPPAPEPPPPAMPPPPAPVVVEEPADVKLEVKPELKKDEPKTDKKWFDRINIRGYGQIRYSNLPSFRENESVINQQGDRSIGPNDGFSIRRARVILFGDVHEKLAIYLQPDFASSAGSQAGVAVLRDWYADVFFDKHKELRVRIGQSKVPYGFENLQSSQNRLPLDRNDAMNSAVRDERDLGAFFYWTPRKYRALFKRLVDENLKGSGDYGIVGFGVYNGQTANQTPDGTQPHVVARVSVPIELGDQIIEVGGGGYYGKYTTPITQPSMGTRFAVEGATAEEPNPALTDARGHVQFVLYPKPLGFVGEYTVGFGPQQGRNTPTRIASAWLTGGYAQLFYKLDNVGGLKALFPFVRGTYYDGGKKFFANAPHYIVKEVSVGLEAQFHKAFEVVLEYDMVRRTNDATLVEEYGHVTRLQAQFNY